MRTPAAILSDLLEADTHVVRERAQPTPSREPYLRACARVEELVDELRMAARLRSELVNAGQPTEQPTVAPRYCVVSDDSGHRWLCPVERRAEAVAHIERVEDFWSSSRRSRARQDVPCDPDDLGYLRRIDGTHRLSFLDPREDL